MTMRAVIDANAMVSGWTLDILMSLAEKSFFQPMWSQKILEEFGRAGKVLGFGEGAERKTASRIALSQVPALRAGSGT